MKPWLQRAEAFSNPPPDILKNLKLQIPGHIAAVDHYPISKSLDQLERDGTRNPITLASNENPWGPSPAVGVALSSAMAKLHRYPDESCFSLKRSLTQGIGVSLNEIVLGSGSNEIIELLLRVFVSNGSEVITGFPSSLMYQRLVRVYSGNNITIPLRGLSHDLTQIIDHISEKTRLIILDNPNNPTGSALNPKDIYSFLSEVPEGVIVLLDEAYVEFMDDEKQLDVFSLIRNNKNRCGVVIIRTFSKAYGLAGMRIGYGVMPEEISTYLHKIRQPYNVNHLAQTAALAAYEDEEYLRQIIKQTRKGKKYLREEVENLGCTCYPSQTNFVLIDVKKDGKKIYLAMLEKGVIIRPMISYGLTNFIRITVGTDEENKRFVSALTECLLDLEDD